MKTFDQALYECTRRVVSYEDALRDATRRTSCACASSSTGKREHKVVDDGACAAHVEEEPGRNL